MFTVILRSFGAFPIFGIFDNLESHKYLVSEQNGPKFGPLGVLSVYEVFWLLRFQSQSEAIRWISEISDFQHLCILKTAGRRAKRNKIWALGVSACT